MSDYIDIREGWLDRVESAISLAFEGEGEAWSDRLSGDRLARVARRALDEANLVPTNVHEVPVPPLPTAPYTVIRVTGSTDPDLLRQVLTSDGGGYWSNSGHTLGPASMDRRVQAFEVLSEPRAVTAKAVLRRVVSGGITTSDDSELLTIAREFGVKS